MRVIAGKARRLLLKSPEGLKTRPTSDRIKETLFNMINNELPDCIFIDLFSGSGGIGIEAVSRGAKRCYFVDNDRDAIDCITQNIQTTKLEEYTNVMYTDALTALTKLESQGVVADIIFLDPPYDKNEEMQVLQKLASSSLVDEYTTIIVESSVKTDFSYLNELGFTMKKQKKYGNNSHVFIELM